MMTFAFFLLGCFAGIFTWLYIDRFIPNLQQEIYQNYIELYPENRPIFHSEKAAIQSQKCGHIFLYFLGGYNYDETVESSGHVSEHTS